MDIIRALSVVYVVAAASAFAILLLIPLVGEWTLLLGIIWIGVVSVAANSVRCHTCGKPVTRREFSADTRSVAPWAGSAFVAPWPETVCSRCGTVLIASKPGGSPDASA
jgi:ribosomal protein S27E